MVLTTRKWVEAIPPQPLYASIGMSWGDLYICPTTVTSNVKLTLKQDPKPSRGGECRCISILSLTSVLDGVGAQRHASAALPPGKSRYPLYRRLGEPQGRPRRVRKISTPPGFDLRTVQPVARRITLTALTL